MSKSIFYRFNKLRGSLAKRYNLLFHSGYSVEIAYGRKFLIDWNHPVDKKLAFEIFEHERIMKFVASVGKQNPNLFLDIGAHAALYSILIQARVPSAEIHAFEPDVTNLGQLYANLFLNRKCDKIIVHPCGLSDQEGSLSFESSGEHEHRAFSKLSPNGNVTVPVKRLDSVLSGEGKKIAMKIDVEGHEIEVIRGGEDLLRKNLCYMQIESSAENFPQLKSLLEDMGYRWLATEGDHYFSNIPDFKHGL